MTRIFRNATILSVWLFATSVAFAQDAAPMDTDIVVASARVAASGQSDSRQKFRSLDEDVQDLKKEVLDLNRDLFLLEDSEIFGRPGADPVARKCRCSTNSSIAMSALASTCLV